MLGRVLRLFLEFFLRCHWLCICLVRALEFESFVVLGLFALHRGPVSILLLHGLKEFGLKGELAPSGRLHHVARDARPVLGAVCAVAGDEIARDTRDACFKRSSVLRDAVELARRQ